MFIRSIKVPSSSGVVHEYVRVVESVRENGRSKQKIVLNLGDVTYIDSSGIGELVSAFTTVSNSGGGLKLPRQGYDDYDNFLRAGSLGAWAKAAGLEQLPWWRKTSEHPAYDSFWKEQALDRTMAAQAIPSYAPKQATAHFNKLECFCFREHTLAPGETKRWPVVFVIDPKLPKDVVTITLSYTFFEVGGKVPTAPRGSV